MTRRHRASSENGALSLEMAIIAPLLIMVLLLIIGFARVAAANSTVDAAAYSGARAASISRNSGQASGDAQGAAHQVLTQEGIDCPADISTDTSGFGTEPGEPASVRVNITCAVPLSDLAVPGLPGTVQITSDASSVIDTYRGRE